MNRFVLIVLVLLPFTVFGVIEDYYRPECNPNSLCVPKVLDNMKIGSNGNFLNHAQTGKFNLQLNYQVTTDLNTYEDYFFVYVVLDSKLIANVLESKTFKSTDTREQRHSYSAEVLETLINAFVYVGSGEFKRMRQHLYFSSSQCPSKEKNFIHAFTTPVSMFICSSVNHPFPEDKSPAVMVYPVMAFETLEAARDVEASLIYFLNNQLVNLDDFQTEFSNSFTHKVPEERHFLAHYALEYMFRFLSIGDDTDRYSLSDIPDYELHSRTTFGLYGSSNQDKKLLYQGNFLYFFQSQNSQVAIWIQLPFNEVGSDFAMSASANNYIINNLVKHFLVIFKKNAEAEFRCVENDFNRKHKAFSDMKSLKKLVEAIYNLMINCFGAPSDNSLSYLLFQRFRAKFEYSLTFMLYVIDEQNYCPLSGAEPNENVPKQIPEDLHDRFEFAVTRFVKWDELADANDRQDNEDDGGDEDENEDGGGNDSDEDGDDNDGDNDNAGNQGSQSDQMEWN